uniref:Melanoma-associated antigen E1-like n=1 Tax=Crassostrea virginica TaxID=6565 RepID=A0A8B8CQ89_CRAVI|nr:melanoma-associated antigen E1-like [Crassostrea virginica]
MEAISCLLDFARREPRTPPSAITTVGSFAASGAASGSPEILVRTFKTSTPKTPATAPRTDCPPRISSRRVLPGNTPRALRRPPSAALGAPPRQEGEESSEMELEIPDIPDTPQSPTMSDITVLSTLSSPVRSESPWLYSGGYTSDDLSEYEYGDPYEGEGPHSDTPPPPCEGHSHQLCVPPAWGERIPGSPARGSVRREPPRSKSEEAAARQKGRINTRPVSESERRGGGRGGILVCGIGRGRGRGQQQPQQQEQQPEESGPVRGNSNRARRGRRGGRGRAKGRGTTIEDDEKN